MASLKGEYLYVLVHPLYKNICKVGQTCRPKERLSMYNTSDPYRRFAYAHIEEVFDRRLGEQAVHRSLASFRVGKTEWFKVHADDAIRLLKSLHSSTIVTSGT